MNPTAIPDRVRLSIYRTMLLIRRVEERLCALYPDQEIKCPIHLYIGQEAVAAGVCARLRKSDYLVSNHRSHGHYLAKGGGLREFFAELYGRRTGCSGGWGGSMHLADPELGLLGSSAIVAGGIPIAVGAALAARMEGRGRVAAVFFGDGAADEGVFYESLNFAALRKLPVVFVCENNFYATNSRQSARQPLDNIYRRGRIFGIPGFRLDGNDAAAVYAAAGRAVERARRGRGPTLLECRTYRWKQHVGYQEDWEGGCRPARELSCWKKRCPLERFGRRLRRSGLLTPARERALTAEIDRRIEAARAAARREPSADTIECDGGD
ncbi:MAG TPA: thiamine pyrophosphate-dependent dehydrogenase E1 component subunit alpha [bacterium]|uniref:Acetoin:2,6-dichlorophenolindophenol oxidoreductase subunit alpha n=1 Tax=candidate division TA06 bacterium ADurb.Bin417 TaxID=1852828 RepID=A0A1V5MGY6_UNCT6|nr:MAG: Acetoin:2,6-dichlorophenolindophenol oxidoreductase subunit alpha [candidate division TA06 bacterium ADurb.Bin417]HNQ35848.1 thiamine pyrophosphate-dependent dehydrogenase E1 component subunit alpha [bacterium]HNS47975.1 thiamine pyrophosphate-dependent dehydrogenase E1 component subunit alpha [bacterium]